MVKEFDQKDRMSGSSCVDLRAVGEGSVWRGVLKKDAICLHVCDMTVGWLRRYISNES